MPISTPTPRSLSRSMSTSLSRSQNRSKSSSLDMAENNPGTANSPTMLGEELRAGPTINPDVIDEEADLRLVASPFEHDDEQFQSWSDADDFQQPVLQESDTTHAERMRLLQEAREREQQELNFQVDDLSDHSLVVGPRVGAGSYGKVHLGYHVSYGEVAVKIVHAHDSKTLSSGLREIYASMTMGEHPNIATVFETRICQGREPSDESVRDISPFTFPLTYDSPLYRHLGAGGRNLQTSNEVGVGRSNDERMRVTVFSRGGQSDREIQEFLSHIDTNGSIDRDDIYFAIISEFCNGGTLYEMLRKGVLQHNDLEAKRARMKSIALCTSYGIQYMHHNDMVHRDLSNTNIMLHYTRLHEDGRPDAESLTAKLIDFGRASVNAVKTMQTNSLSTVSYSAPEFMMRGDSSKASDIFSLGVLMWEVWTGCCAWAGARDVQVMYAVTSGKTLDIPEDAPCDLMMLMQACMSFDPNERPEIDDVVERLERITEAQGGGLNIYWNQTQFHEFDIFNYSLDDNLAFVHQRIERNYERFIFCKTEFLI